MASCAWMVVFSVIAVSTNGEPVVKSRLGTISGKSESFENVEVESFLGVPYAKPPLGELRFAHPQAFGPVGELKATQFSAICPQPKIAAEAGTQSEDCLYLNIRRQAGTQPDSKKAVVFIIHGGAFAVGAASTDTYNTIAMVALGDVIAVSFNYRLGMLGFADMKDLAPGNHGLYDQLMALEWVHDNIEAFGGDPEKVTLFGMSAGSISVEALLATPLVRGKNLFKQAVMDSGVLSRSSTTSQDFSLNRVKAIAEKLGCATEGEEMLSCLREADATILTELSYDPKLSRVFTFLPTVDGKFVPIDPTTDTLQNSDKFEDVRIMIGDPKNEGSMFAAMFPASLTVQDKASFRSLSEKMSREFWYPLDMENEEVKDTIVEAYFGKSTDHFHDAAEFLAEGTFICPVSVFVKNFAKTHKNVYVYKFTRKLKSLFMAPGLLELLGVFHGSGYLHFSGAPMTMSKEKPEGLLDPEDKQFITESVRMLTEFVKSSEVPELEGVTWPNYSETEEILVIGDTIDIKPGTSFVSSERCEKVFPFLHSIES